jgi:hypothetical protein
MTGEMIRYKKSRKMSSRKSRGGGSGVTPELHPPASKTYEDYKKNLEDLLVLLEKFKNDKDIEPLNINFDFNFRNLRQIKKQNFRNLRQIKKQNRSLKEWLEEIILEIKVKYIIKLPTELEAAYKEEFPNNVLTPVVYEGLRSWQKRATETVKTNIKKYIATTKNILNKRLNAIKIQFGKFAEEKKIFKDLDFNDKRQQQAKEAIILKFNILIEKVQQIAPDIKVDQSGGSGAEVALLVIIIGVSFVALSGFALVEICASDFVERESVIIRIFNSVSDSQYNPLTKLRTLFKSVKNKYKLSTKESERLNHLNTINDTFEQIKNTSENVKNIHNIIKSLTADKILKTLEDISELNQAIDNFKSGLFIDIYRYKVRISHRLDM